MKNLKRVLSLGLASVMLMGMMVVGAGAADFTDVEDIQHTEAVNTLVALNVINGKDDGSFDPQGNVTRAEMAKMIAVAMQGGVDVDTGVKTVPSFTDISDSWAQSYIEYCADLGIISGRGDGTFDPTGDVTAIEATKMVLTAAGYDADAFQLTGEKWATRTSEVARTARPNSLFDDLDGVVLNAPASREVAAQLIWNGLQTYVVTIAPVTDKVSTGLEWQYDTTGTTTLLKQRYNADIWVGTFEGNYNTGSTGAAKGEITVAGDLDGTDTSGASYVATNAHFPSDYDISFIGEQVKVVFKDGGTGSTKRQPDKYDTIYGVFNTGETQVLRVTKADIKETDSDDLAKGRVKIAGTLYDVAAADDAAEVVVNNYYNGATVYGDDISGTANTDATAAQIATRLQDKMANGNGGLRGNSTDPVKFIFDSNGKICKAYVENWTPRTVLSVTSSKIQFEGMTAKDLDDVVDADDLEEDDVVAVAAFYNVDPVYQVKKLETIDGTIEAVDGSKVKVDGVWYSKADSTTYSVTRSGSSVTAADTAAVLGDYKDDASEGVGDDYTLVLDGSYWIAADVISAATDYGMVIKAAKGITDQVKLLLADGSEQTYAVNKDSTIYVDSSDVLKGGDLGDSGVDVNTNLANAVLVKYETLKSGTEIKMWSVTSVTSGTSGTHSFVKNTKQLTVSAADSNGGSDTTETMLVSSSAVIFAYNGSKWKAYDANSIGNYDSATGSTAQYATKSGKVVAFAMTGKDSSLPTATGSGTLYGYVTGKVYTKDGDDTYTVLDVWDGEETVTVTVDSQSDVRKGDFITAPISSSAISDSEINIGGWSDNHDDINAGAYKVKEVDSKRSLVVTTDGQYGPNGLVVETETNVYRYDSETLIIGVDTDNTKGVTISAIPTYTKATGSDYDNVYIILGSGDDKDLIKAIFVDSDNKLQYRADSTSDAAATGQAGTVIDISELKIAAPTADACELNWALTSPSVSKVLVGEEFTYALKLTANTDETNGAVVAFTANSDLTLVKVESSDSTNAEVQSDNTVKVLNGQGQGITLTYTVKLSGTTATTDPTVTVTAGTN